MTKMRVGIEPILDKNDIIYGYRLLEPLRRPCATCGHESDYYPETHSIDRQLFDRWNHLQNELLQVNMQLARIHNSTGRLYNDNIIKRRSDF